MKPSASSCPGHWQSGGAYCWRRCRDFLAQVGKKGGDLRQEYRLLAPFLPGTPPNSRTEVLILCAVSVVAVRHRPKSALGARQVATEGLQAGGNVRQFGEGEVKGEREGIGRARAQKTRGKRKGRRSGGRPSCPLGGSAKRRGCAQLAAQKKDSDLLSSFFVEHRRFEN